MFRIYCVWLFVILFSVDSYSLGNKNIENVIVKLKGEPIQVLSPWSKESAYNLYKKSIGSDKIYDLEILDMVITFSMFLRFSSAPLVFGINNLLDPINKDSREIIKNACFEEYGDDIWELLACVSRSVLLTVAESMEGSDRRSIFFTACRTVANSVKLIFNSYKIPNIRVTTSNILLSLNGKPYGHAVNVITITSDSGAYYSYAFDAGNEPEMLFPNNEYTTRHHDKHGELMPRDIYSNNISYGFRPAYK